ncbi:hypothetical protein QP905_08490 [Corynebacterium pseudodiphtheriticum]|uniref:hypothetical protein n=1 Tax=Corynebacterium pseudodiphtheriticum TaxID=37637 RepID=UPI00254AE3DF|nr:hypothetical protein [Corynebacterium pseudodiphtheriticum]MDK8578381.1 hypothetical protein [Corynebacterium pseudodiphtheriticum]
MRTHSNVVFLRERTVIVRASLVRDDYEIHRHIGVSESLTLAELADVLVTCFDLRDEQTPWHFTPTGRLPTTSRAETSRAETSRVDPQHLVGEYLGSEHAGVNFHWGLWVFQLQTVETYPRDKETPVALCVGGSGSFLGSKFDLTAINAQLTGPDAIDQVLAEVNPEVGALIRRSGVTDLVPLLQAIDLGRECAVDAQVRARLEQLPLETEPRRREAFWACVLGLSCMGGPEMTDEIAGVLFAALGDSGQSGQTGQSVKPRQLCADSLSVLGQCVAEVAPVDRLDLYRVLLRGESAAG